MTKKLVGAPPPNFLRVGGGKGVFWDSSGRTTFKHDYLALLLIALDTVGPEVLSFPLSFPFPLPSPLPLLSCHGHLDLDGDEAPYPNGPNTLGDGGKHRKTEKNRENRAKQRKIEENRGKKSIEREKERGKQRKAEKNRGKQRKNRGKTEKNGGKTEKNKR